MWESRNALSVLSLVDRDLVLDVGCGTGELSEILTEETPGTVIGIDRDRTLLREAPLPTVQSDALRLPVRDDAADLTVCQALLVNLPDPVSAITEFARCSADLVGAIEPDNSAVAVESTVPAEEDLTARARENYIRGVTTDVTLGAVPELFREAGLRDVRTRRYDHIQLIEPPYEKRAITAAKRIVTGERLSEQRETILAGGMEPAEFDRLRSAWREMGRDVVESMHASEYRRREVIPFHVTVGTVNRQYHHSDS